MDVVPIHEAKTQFSKLVKRAEAGEVIYVGAYGKASAVIAPIPPRKERNLGAWKDKNVTAIDYDALDLYDEEISKLFEKSSNEELL